MLLEDDEYEISPEELNKIKSDLRKKYANRLRYELFEDAKIKKGNDRRWYVWDNLEQKRMFNGKLMTRADAKGRLTSEKKSQATMYVERNQPLPIYEEQFLSKHYTSGYSSYYTSHSSRIYPVMESATEEIPYLSRI